MENEVAAVVAEPAGNPYGFGALIEHGNFISWTLLLVLLVMSLGTWYVMFTKWWDQHKLIKAARNVEKNFWSAGSAREGVDRLPKDDDFRVIAESTLRAAGHYEGRLADRISIGEWLNMAISRQVEGLSGKLSGGLSFLATVGSTAPFVGLLGTVYGILAALIKIGLSGQPSIDQVAGPVGEALIFTALGLVVAVPAVFCYNVLVKRNKVVMEVVREFTGDLAANLIGGMKPELPAAPVRPAAPAAPAAVKK